MIETIKKIQAVNDVLALPLPDEMKFRPGYEMAQNEAKRTLETLRKKLGDEVADVAVAVYVDGENAKTLAAAMLDQTDGAVADLDDIYETLVKQVSQSVGRNREFGVNQYALVLRELRQLAAANGLAGIETPTFSGPFVFENEDVLRQTVVDLASRAVGVELAVNYIRKQTVESASKLNEKTPVFPVFVLNCRVDRDLLTKKLFRRGLDATVKAPAEVNEEAAINALKSIKKSLKQTKE